MRDDVVQLAGDRQALLEEGGRGPSGTVPSAAQRPEDDRADPDAETGRAEERVLAGPALDERAQEDDEPGRHRDGDGDGVRMAIGQGRAVRLGHGPQA